MKNKIENVENYEYKDMFQMLKEENETDYSREVLYTFGDQELIKEEGKYYLAHTIYPEKTKEITRETATELWQTCAMKPRSDVSMNFDNNKYNLF